MSKKTMSSQVRVRFAPSPTGHLHIGSLRTALFNVLFARHHNGAFLIRIEDTDLQRSKKEYVNSILEALDWCDIHADEPIMFQTDGRERHQLFIKKLLSEGKAYHCYCSEDDLTQRKETSGDAWMGYDGQCQKLTDRKDGPFVVRFKIPADCSSVSFNDSIRGNVTISRDQLSDFVIARSDGSPVYNFVVVIDDNLMKITHVIRGEDHISNTPKQILLYQALGFEVPRFAHLPLILNPEGGRLSKRDAATSVLDYKDQGYLSDALINYLVRLGWSHGDQEIFSRAELVSLFSLEQVGKKGAIFDMEKLGWLNGVYIRDMSDADLLQKICDLRSRFRLELKDWSDEQVLACIHMYKQRATTVTHLADSISSFYKASTPYHHEDVKRWVNEDTLDHLRQTIEQFEHLDHFNKEDVQSRVKELSKQLGCKLVVLAQPIRIALTGLSSGPGVFELLVTLGKKESIYRLHKFIKYIDENKLIRH